MSIIITQEVPTCDNGVATIHGHLNDYRDVVSLSLRSGQISIFNHFTVAQATEIANAMLAAALAIEQARKPVWTPEAAMDGA